MGKFAALAAKTYFLVIPTLLLGFAKDDPDVDIRFEACSVQRFSGNGVYRGNRGFVISNLVNYAPEQPNMSYVFQSPLSTNICYGGANCNPAITPTDCYSCLKHARIFLNNYCHQSIGATMFLMDCYLRIEDYPFSL